MVAHFRACLLMTTRVKTPTKAKVTAAEVACSLQIPVRQSLRRTDVVEVGVVSDDGAEL